MDTLFERKCSACGGTNLQYGSSGVHRHTFVPEKKIMFTGYEVNAFLCLDCGTLGYFLSDKDLETVRKEQARQK